MDRDIMARLQSTRSGRWFALGCMSIVAGVFMHVPMLAHAHASGNRLSGMDVDPSMMLGMALIVLGAASACYGTLPERLTQRLGDAPATYEAPPSTALSSWHAGLIGVLIIGLVIDVMKPATLGFVLPGLAREYGIQRSTAALLPLAALTGTTVGSVLWGWMADYYGRRASIIVSTILFVSTSVCGAMPSFEWNLIMCFLMGASAGGMLPVIYTLLAEILPPRHRSWLLVMVGGTGLAGGYFAASLTAHLLEPSFGWRALWLQGFPTGILLLALSRIIPESPHLLAARGRQHELDDLCRKFGLRAVPFQVAVEASVRAAGEARLQTGALVMAALAWSLVNFGILLWLPTDLQQRWSSSSVTGLLAWSAALGFPAVVLAAWSYSQLSAKWTLVGAIVLTAAGLSGLLFMPSSTGASLLMLTAMVALLAGANGTIATLLPFTTENYSPAVRGRVTGLVAGSSKIGGVGVQSIALLGVFPTIRQAAIILVIPTLLSAGLIAKFCGPKQRVN